MHILRSTPTIASKKTTAGRKYPTSTLVYEEVGRPQLLPSNEHSPVCVAVPDTPSAKSLQNGPPSHDNNGGTHAAYGEGVAVADVAKQVVGVFSHTGSAVMNAMPAGAIHAPSQPATGIGDDGGAPLYYEDEV